MADANLELRKAIVAALKADAAFAQLCGTRIYDRVPQKPVLPYAAFATIQVRPYETREMDGAEARLQIDTVDRHENGGAVRAERVMRAIADVLHNNEALVLEAGNLVLAQLVLQTTRVDRDLRTVHGVQQFRFITHPD